MKTLFAAGLLAFYAGPALAYTNTGDPTATPRPSASRSVAAEKGIVVEARMRRRSMSRRTGARGGNVGQPNQRVPQRGGSGGNGNSGGNG